MRPLTRRQREVCVLMVVGLTTKEIGKRLGLSPRTVEDHRARVFKKYHVRGAVQFLRKMFDFQPGQAA